MNRWLIGSLMCLWAVSCHKPVPVNVSGSDDEQMDRHLASFEELQSKSPAETCQSQCTQSRQACDLSTRICAISGRQPERADFQQRCVSAQEECAKWRDRCDHCS